MKNVLLFSMSLVTDGTKKSQYYYDLKSRRKYFSGYMTNEAPTKALIEKLAENGDKIDEIVMICSNKSQAMIRVKEPENKRANHVFYHRFKDGATPNDVRHYEFYSRQIVEYLEEEYPEVYEGNKIPMKLFSVEDYFEEQDVAQKAIEVADYITDSGEDVCLHIDFNGGQRSMALMLLSVSKLMKIRGVSTETVFSMNFDNPKNEDEYVAVQEMPAIFSSVDLVSAINEYINYGRINGLRTYFSSVEDTQIQDILSQMQEFAENLQLCRTGYIMVKRGKLLAALEEYIRQHQESTDAYDILFEYVAEDILKGYDGLLNGSLPDVILWCIEKEFTQQALTFCTELLPGYFWDQEIFAPSLLEREQYRKFLNLYIQVRKEKVDENADSNDLQKKAVAAANALKYSYRNEISEDSYAYKYNWLTSYLKWDLDSRQKYEAIYAYKNIACPKLTLQKRVKKVKIDLFKIGIDESKVDDDGGAKMCMKVLNTTVSTENDVQNRAYSYLMDQPDIDGKAQTLTEILAVYHMLKHQRNLSNHASEGDEYLSYSRLCDVMRGFVVHLKYLASRKQSTSPVNEKKQSDAAIAEDLPI